MAMLWGGGLSRITKSVVGGYSINDFDNLFLQILRYIFRSELYKIKLNHGSPFEDLFRLRPMLRIFLQPTLITLHAIAHSADSNTACSSTVCVAFSCLSGG